MCSDDKQLQNHNPALCQRPIQFWLRIEAKLQIMTPMTSCGCTYQMPQKRQMASKTYEVYVGAR